RVGDLSRRERAPRAGRGRRRRRVHCQRQLRSGPAPRYRRQVDRMTRPLAPAGRDTPIRVLVVDDSAVQRSALAALLDADPEIEVIGWAANGVDALRKAAALKPDVVTINLHM